MRTKPTPKSWPRIAAVVAIALAMAAGPTAALAENSNPRVLPPHSHAFGKTYGEWSAAWWQYVLSQPTASNPLFDPTGAGCNAGQSGPVFFLVGTFNGGTATRTMCTVPAGKALFFPLVNAFDVHVPGDGLDTPEILWDDLHVTFGFGRFSDFYASVDGVPVRNLNPADTPYRACAGPVAGCAPSFSLTVPADNLLSVLAGSIVSAGTYAPTVADGFYLLLAPLPPGTHTIEFGGKGFLGGEFSQAIKYTLTVK